MSGAVPAGNTSEDKDLEKVLAACHDRLPPPAQWSAFAGYPDSLALSVIDAIWSVGTRYAITTGVINRYIARRRLMGADAMGDDLTDLLSFYDHLGGIDAFIQHIGTRNRVSTQPGATLKGAAVQEAATALLSLDINTAAQFRAAATTDLGDEARTAWTAVPGQSSGVSWRYLRMLLGLPDVKPDRMVIRFIASAMYAATSAIPSPCALMLGIRR